jgi:hypothetical protein
MKNLLLVFSLLLSSIAWGQVTPTAVKIGGKVTLANFTDTSNYINPLVGVGAGVGISTGSVLTSCFGYFTCGGSGAGMTGIENTAIGWQAMNIQTTGGFNVAVGTNVMGIDTTGNLNTCVGNDCMRNSVGTVGGVGVGKDALRNEYGSGNTAVGFQALSGGSGNLAANTLNGVNNTAIGYQSMDASTMTTGHDNTAVGTGTLGLVSTGINNTVVGSVAGQHITTGSSNIIIVPGSVEYVCATGSSDIIIGGECLANTSSNEINIGGLLFFNNTSTAVPVISACGTSPSVDSHANVKSGTVTVGSTATSCTITFASAYSSWNHCRVTSQSNLAAFAYTYTKTAITTTATVLGGDLIDYDCDGY